MSLAITTVPATAADDGVVEDLDGTAIGVVMDPQYEAYCWNCAGEPSLGLHSSEADAALTIANHHRNAHAQEATQSSPCSTPTPTSSPPTPTPTRGQSTSNDSSAGSRSWLIRRGVGLRSCVTATAGMSGLVRRRQHEA